jgi:hypothetical protein
MTLTGTLPKDRMRLSRYRRSAGVTPVSIEVPESLIEHLIEIGCLDSMDEDNKTKIAAAVEHLLRRYSATPSEK